MRGKDFFLVILLVAIAISTSFALSLTSLEETGKAGPPHAVSSDWDLKGQDQTYAATWINQVTASLSAYANQDFETANNGYDIFIADDFTFPVTTEFDYIYAPGGTWNAGCDLTCASLLNWRIYADSGGVPAGYPGGGSGPTWSLSLPPTDNRVTLTPDDAGFLSNVALSLGSPIVLGPGKWWLLVYPSLDYSACSCQAGRYVAATTIGSDAHVINPGGGFGFPTIWTPITAPSTWATANHDAAFRIGTGTIFADSFETGAATSWSLQSP